MPTFGGKYYNMELIKFLEDYGGYFSFRKLESDSGMSERSLGKVLRGERDVPIKSIPKLLGIFSGMGIDLKYDRIDNRKKPVKEQPRLLPMKIGEWKPSIRGHWTNGVITRIPVMVDGERYYEP